METEAAERSMMAWLSECLPLHTFVPRHFESEDREPSVLRNAHLKATKYAKIRQDKTRLKRSHLILQKRYQQRITLE